MKRPDKANPKEEKKNKDLKTTTAKEPVKKTDKKEDTKTSTTNKTITKNLGTQGKINVHRKEDDNDDSKKTGVKHTYINNLLSKTVTDNDKKEFTSTKLDDSISLSEKDAIQEISTNLVKNTQITENSNDSKSFNTVNSNSNVNIDIRDSLAQKEKDISQLKQAINEQKQYQDEMNKLVKENNLLKKEKAELLANVDQLNKDNEMFSTELSTLLEDNEKLVKTNLELTSNIKELEEKLKSVDTFETEIENLKIDLEIKNEECEGLKLELINAKNLNLMDLDPDSEKAKIIELEQNLKATENALLKLDEQKNAEIHKLQKELKDKTEKAKNADILPQKDEEIKILKIKLEEALTNNTELREQLNIFSGASMMMDGLISQKISMELELEKERKEKEGLKVEIDTTEQLLQEYEDAQRISQEIIREKENSVIELNNSINRLKIYIEEYEKKNENLVKSYNQIKNENTILRDELRNSTNQNVNVDQILNKNSNIFSKLKTYMRKSVIEKLLNTDYTLQKFKFTVISEMIPKQILDKGGYDSFDRYLLLVSIRKKIYYLLFNIFENDFIKDEQNDNNDKVMEQENSKYFSFLRNLINTLVDLNCMCLSLEIIFSNFEKNDFKTISKAPLWNNVIALSKIINNLTETIKADNFSIKFQFEPIKVLIKVIQEEAKNNLKINLEEDKNPISLYNSEILKFTSNLLINYETERNNFPGAAKVVNNLYKQVKKTLKKIDEKFVFNFISQDQVFEIENNYYLKFLEASKTLYNGTYESPTPKYETLCEPLNKLCIIIMNYLEKLDKEEINNKESETKLPLNSWVELCLEVKNELIESVKTKEDLDNCLKRLDETKLEKMQLEAKIEDNNRNKLVNDKKLAEALLIAGKVPQLEEQINEFKRKIEKYNTTIDNLREQLEIESSKAKNLQLKVDIGMPNNPIGKKNERSTRRGIPFDGNQMQSMGMSSGNLMTDSIPLLNTICDLQKERKYLKSKLMKEKLEDLLGENSYINRYIDKVSKLNYHEEREKLLKMEGEMENLNKNYKYVRMKLCSPKILDLASENYNYEKFSCKQENKVAKIRVDNIRNVDKIMYNLFGDNSLDKTFKEVIDNDITKTLKYITEKKLLVGKISFNNNDQGVSENNKKIVPVYLSETSLKMLNKTFLN